MALFLAVAPISQVANEEQKHYIMIDELIQFIQRDEEPDWESYRLDDSLYDNINRVDVA